MMKDLSKTVKPKDFLKKLREAENFKIKLKNPCDKIQWLDPYVLNTRIETEWKYNTDRLELLESIANNDQREFEKKQIELEKREKYLNDTAPNKISNGPQMDSKKIKAGIGSKLKGLLGMGNKKNSAKEKTKNNEVALTSDQRAMNLLLAKQNSNQDG